MRWHILGAGAIGALFAERLSDAGLDCCLLLRDQAQLLALQRLGARLQIHRPEGQRHLSLQAEAVLQPPDSPPASKITHLLVTTKAYDSLPALLSLLPRLAEDAQVVLLQNGLGHQQQVAERLAPRPVWAAITTCGAYRNGPFEITPAGAGQTTLGRIDSTGADLPDGWDRLGTDIHSHPRILQPLWQKLAINAAINPLTALYGCRNGELLTQPDYRQQLSALCTEIELIAAARQQPLFEQPLLEAVSAVAEATAANFSSMLQDVRAGRRTEIDQITGFLCAEAGAVNLQAPLNSALLKQIQRLPRSSDE